MSEHAALAERFEADRGHLRAVAYRMLGSLSDADDAVQETWLRLARTDIGEVADLTAWLRTVTSRICLDMLRSRTARREDPVDELDDLVPDRTWDPRPRRDPEQAAIQADSVSGALLVVLGTLTPAERIAFVLHDMFAVPFTDIAAVLDRSTAAAKKLASRARIRVHGTPVAGRDEIGRNRRLVERFLSAVRRGDIDALLDVLDPDVVRHADRAVLPSTAPTELRGAQDVVDETVGFARTARFAEIALVNGAVGLVVAPRGRLFTVITAVIKDDKVTEYQVIGEPDRLRELDLAVLE